MKRIIYASQETRFKVDQTPGKKLGIYSFFPADKSDCVCQKEIREIKEKLATLNEEQRHLLVQGRRILECKRPKAGASRYKVTCPNCGEVVGYCWATDNTLKDWFDFHYVQWTDGERWYGCLTPQISPIDEKLCLECCCGWDTRDFRANMTLPHKIAMVYEEDNKVGREFGRSDSKFKVSKVGKDVLPFN